MTSRASLSRSVVAFFVIDEMLALNGSSTPTLKQNRLFKKIGAQDVVRPKLVFKLFINCFLIIRTARNLVFNTENNGPYDL